MKSIIVTGAAGGIGYSVTKLLAESGFLVFALDLKEVPKTDNVISFICNLKREDEIKKVHDHIKEYGKVEGIIHLAGSYYMDSLVEIEEVKLKRIFDTNFFSVFLVNKVMLDLIDKKGKIVITSSEVAPLDPLPFNGVYSLTKSTLENYALSLRQELNLLDIQVIIVRPGAINTGLIDESIENVRRVSQETKLYKDNAPLFEEIVKKHESKTIEPIKIAKLIKKIVEKKRPRLLYTINLNFRLILLSILPKRLQLRIIKRMITPRGNKGKSKHE